MRSIEPGNPDAIASEFAKLEIPGSRSARPGMTQGYSGL